ncbi:hypothetical protein Q8F55_000521 [Vanrija albida]|uniref:Carboxypeptidase n=1 Tax=Vanrija albida TaxID=181172 RepID=A0ABR3QEE4_9TREE
MKPLALLGALALASLAPTLAQDTANTAPYAFPTNPLASWPSVAENEAAAAGVLARRGYGGKGKGHGGKGHGHGHGHGGKCKPRPETPVNTTGYRYYHECTKDFLTAPLPDVNWDLGEMYSGNIPIDPGNPNNTLFFVFKPRDGPPVDELTIWLNGGPGCSSLFGFVREIGPMMWAAGQARPRPNPYSWANLTNVLFVDQPVGTGFSTGTPTARSAAEVATQFADWFGQFSKTFGIRNYKIFVTGESYGGQWVSYITSEFFARSATDKSTYDVRGNLVYSGVVGDYPVQHDDIPALPFIEGRRRYFGFTDEKMDALRAKAARCGWTEYYDKYMAFPPAGVQPQLEFRQDCSMFPNTWSTALKVNPCDDPNGINHLCPAPDDLVFGIFGRMFVPSETLGYTLYFERPDVVKALNAPTSKRFTMCVRDALIGTGRPGGYPDDSPPAIQAALPQSIDGTGRVLLVGGDLDFNMAPEGILLALQNTTWGGQLGFQSRPNSTFYVHMLERAYQHIVSPSYPPNFVTGGQGPMGTWGQERGLAWVHQDGAGHAVPEGQGRAAVMHLEWLLGHRQGFGFNDTTAYTDGDTFGVQFDFEYEP